MVTLPLLSDLNGVPGSWLQPTEDGVFNPPVSLAQHTAAAAKKATQDVPTSPCSLQQDKVPRRG